MPSAAAIVGSALLSSRASGKASDAAAGAADRSAAQIAEAGKLAREDVLKFFPGAQEDLFAGAGGAFDILGGGVQEQQRALSQGNLAAQQTLGGGFGQIRSALLGLPVDQAGFAPQGIDFTAIPQNPFAPQARGGIGETPPGATFQDGVATGPGFVTAPGLPTQGSFGGIGNLIQQREFERTAAGPRDLSALVAQARTNPRTRAQQRGAESIRVNNAINQLAALGFDPQGRPLGV